MPTDPIPDLVPLIAPYPPGAPHGLLLFLRSVQAKCNWIPPQALQLAAEHFQKPYTQVYEAAAFTPGLSLEPQGRHVIKVCHGVSCREAGSQDLLKEYCRLLGVKVDQVTLDGEFGLRSTPCLGFCAIGANVVLDSIVAHGQSLADCGANIAALRVSKTC